MVRQQNKDKYIVIIPRLNTSIAWVLLTCVFVIQLEGPNNLDTARVGSADEALKNLKEGNAGFVGGKSRHLHDTSDRRQSLEKQIPQAVHQNVKQSARRLSPVPKLRKRLKGNNVKIVDAVDDVHNGKVALK